MRRPRRFSWLLGVAVFALVAVGPARAAAFGDTLHVGVKGGLAFQNDKDLGWAAGAHGAYGLSDMFDAELEFLTSQNPEGSSITSAAAGIAYKVDILRWIPYVGLLGGYYHYGGNPGPNGESGSTGGMALQLGLDFLMTREVALGLDFRWHFSAKDELYSPLRTLLFGAEYRFEL